MSAYDSFHNSNFSQALPRNPDGVLNILDNYLRLRVHDGKKIATGSDEVDPSELWQVRTDGKEAGLLVIPVTGRPAGWCDMVARFWPVDAVVGENGAFWMWRDARLGKLRTRFIQSEAERADGRRRLEAVRTDVLREVPGADIASDQPYRLADLAVDFCEDVPPLPRTDIERIVAIFERHGAHAKVSSIHVNGWFGAYDKLGKVAIRFAVKYVRHRYRRQIRIGAGAAALALAIAAYAATRNVPEG